MKILITTDAYDAMVNGVAISVKTLFGALKEAGHEVRILTLSQTLHSYQDGDVYYIGSAPLKIYPDARATLAFRNSLLDDILEWEPDVIHSQCEFFTFVFAQRIAKQLHIPIVHTYHTLYEYYTHYFCPSETVGRKVVAMGSRWICNRTDAVIAPTQKTARILEGYGVSSPIHVIPTGLSLERLQKNTGNKQRNLKVHLHIPEDAPVIVTLGRLAREKNVDFLIAQMKHPKIQELGLHFVIVGDGPDRERLETLMNNLNLRETVHFTGMVAPEEVAQYYRLGNVFVSASSSETQGLTYIEAMACGLPLLCFQDLCLESVLIPRYNGFFFQDDDSFVDSCCELFGNHHGLKAMGQNALQTASQFSKETFAHRALQIYKDVILQSQEAYWDFSYTDELAFAKYKNTNENRKEHPKCTRFACIPKRIWHKVTGY
ncbi:MAG: glycosyltransferase family 4 protein [Tyzzerella sp.]|nr:glycosyltransferase family 4 protein [Tyzzerella sp.]